MESNFIKYHLLVLILLVAAAYSNSLHGPFIYDDDLVIKKNSAIQIDEVSSDSITHIFKESRGRKRFVSNISFALNYRFGQLDTFGYHVVNTGIHILSTIFLYLLFIEIFSLSAMSEYYPYRYMMAFAIAGLWSLNPVQVQSVTYITQRMNSLAGMFYFAGFLGGIKAIAQTDKLKKIGFSIMASIGFVLAMGSKEMAVTLPVIFLLYIYFFCLKDDKKEFLRFYKMVAVAFLGIFIVVWMIIGFANPIDFVKEVFFGNNVILVEEDYTTVQRMLSETRVVLYYISLFLFPAIGRLRLLYDFPPSNSLFDPYTTVVAIIIIITLFVVALKNRKRPFLSFFILWYFITLAVESSVLKLHLVFEHRLYIPSVGITAITVVGIFMLAGKYKKKSDMSDGRLATGVCFTLMILLAFMSYKRNEAWQNNMTFFEDNVKKSPNSYKARTNLGVIYREKGMTKKALEQFEVASKILPSYFNGYYLKGTAHSKAGNWEAAIKEYELASRYSPGNAFIKRKQGEAYFKKGMLKEALQQYDIILAKVPGDVESHINKGIIFSRVGQYERAIGEFSEAVKRDPESSKASFNLAILFSKTNNWEKAIELYDKTLVVEPDKYEAYHYKGDIYKQLRNYELAVQNYKKAISINTLDYHARMGLVLTYAETGKVDKAIEGLESTVAKSIALSDSAYLLMGDLYVAKGRIKDADTAYKDALVRRVYFAAYKLGVLNIEKFNRGLEAERYFKMFLQNIDRKKYPEEVEKTIMFLNKNNRGSRRRIPD